MLTFVDEFLQPEPGTITRWPDDMDSPVAGTWSIHVPLEPWSADDEYEPETFRPGAGGPELVRTQLVLDWLDLPGEFLGQLSGVASELTGPDRGFAEGSIYLIACHYPIDIRRIAFGAAEGDWITAELDLYFDFDRAHGIGIANRDARIRARLRLTSPEELMAAMRG